uniref:Cytochrome b561 domain-containing protein n=1 Tax=Macrostomum lignano TaxID=282301 RepID=A0A1I8FD62_9PLAT
MPYENLDHPGASGGSSNTGEPSMKMRSGLLAVILTAVWMSVYHGGFSWVPERVFNFHPLFHGDRAVFLYADGILVYRVFRSVKKFRVKVCTPGWASPAVLLFLLQWVGGLIHFPALPQTPQSYRKMYLPIHQHWGVILFCMTTVTAITGITEKNAFHDDASKLPAWEKLSNTLGFVLGIFCILVV